jgi:hypothetical protein
MAKVRFVLLNPKSAGFSFNSYNDKDYNEVFYQTGADNFGNPVKKRVTFKNRVESFDENQKVPARFCPKDEKDRPIQMTVVEFIRNSPFCLEEGDKRTPIHRIKELNSKKAAQISNSKDKDIFRAKSVIYNADANTVSNLSALFGYLGDDEDMRMETCLRACENNPNSVIDAAENDSTEYRAVLKDLLVKGIVEKRGTLLEYKAPRAAKAITLGLDEDDAVSKLMKDKPLYASIKKRLEK